MEKITGTKIFTVNTLCEDNVYSVVVTDDPSREWANVLEIRHKGELIGSYLDHGEPEDNSFYRGYKWIAVQLEKAFELGRLAAVQETMKEVEELRKMVEECQTGEAERESGGVETWNKVAGMLMSDGRQMECGPINKEDFRQFWQNMSTTVDKFGNAFEKIFMEGVAGNEADVKLPRQLGEEAPPLRGGEDDKMG